MSKKELPGTSHCKSETLMEVFNNAKTLKLRYENWDPTSSRDWTHTSPPRTCVLRVKRDIMAIYKEPLPGIYIVPDESDLTLIHAVITGPYDTPYHGGYFYFLLRCPPDYPISPPRVKLMTTGEGKVRFNPNLYDSGKVCLSILGTWAGPSWSPVQTVSTVLLSIQSLMSEKPYFNEPGYEEEWQPGDSDRYNEIIKHETLRVAVCDMLEGRTCDARNMPQVLRDKIERSFLNLYEHYESQAKKGKKQNKQPMCDPFSQNKGHYDYSSILKRLQDIKVTLDAKPELKTETEDSLPETIGVLYREAEHMYEEAADTPLEEFLFDGDEEMSEEDNDSSDEGGGDTLSEEVGGTHSESLDSS